MPIRCTVLGATGTREVRRRLLPARLVVYFVLALWLFRGRNSGYGQVMAKLADGLYHRRRGADLLAGQLDPDGWVAAGAGRRWRQPGASSLSRARDKLGADPLHMLFDHVAGPVAAGGVPGVSCCGLRVISMDGSTTDVPDSAENAAFFGRPSTVGRDGAFPQVRWVTAAESGTGALTGATFGRYGTGEQTLALDLLPSFGPGMLVLADRNFLSWSLARAVLATGAQILWRASASFTLKPVTALADGTYLAERKPPRKSDGPVLTVRVIEYTVHTRAEGDGTEEPSEVFCLVTSLGEGQPVLRSKDPEGVAQEMWALFAVYQAICTIAGIGASAMGIPPDRISFPHALAAAAVTVAAFPPLTRQTSHWRRSYLKILMPGFFVRDRPDRASPRKTKKAGDFPARKPGEPGVTRRIEFHLLYPWQVT